MEHEIQHWLLLMGNIDSSKRKRVVSFIQREMADWFNYSPDAWLLCVPTKLELLKAHLSEIFTDTTSYYLLAEMRLVDVRAGALPETAWTWLRRHRFMGWIDAEAATFPQRADLS